MLGLRLRLRPVKIQFDFSKPLGMLLAKELNYPGLLMKDAVHQAVGSEHLVS